MNELMFRNPFAEIEAMMNSMFDNTFETSFRTRGLKKYIKRPHNLKTVKDENGNPVEYTMEIVYTPFKKNEVKVEILDGVLTVKCGSENKVKDEDMDYCGISHQSYEFSLPLSETVDTEKISAKAEDGILYITLPVKKVEEKKVEPQTIEVK